MNNDHHPRECEMLREGETWQTSALRGQAEEEGPMREQKVGQKDEGKAWQMVSQKQGRRKFQGGGGSQWPTCC